MKLLLLHKELNNTEQYVCSYHDTLGPTVVMYPTVERSDCCETELVRQEKLLVYVGLHVPTDAVGGTSFLFTAAKNMSFRSSSVHSASLIGRAVLLKAHRQKNLSEVPKSYTYDPSIRTSDDTLSWCIHDFARTTSSRKCYGRPIDNSFQIEPCRCSLKTELTCANIP